MGWDMKAGWSAGSGFLSEWLLINGADEGHNSSPAQDCHSARPLSDHNCPHAAGLLLTLFCFFFFFQFERINVYSSSEKSKPLTLSLFLFFFFTTHTFGEREKTLRESVAADLSKIKPFLPPISLESQSVLNDFQNRRWFVSVSPLDIVCRIRRSKGHAARLRWALIAWTPTQSLNTVVWMSLPACQLKKRPALNFCSL